MTTYRVEVWTGGGTRLHFRTEPMHDKARALLVYADQRRLYVGAGFHVVALTYENSEGSVSVVTRDQ